MNTHGWYRPINPVIYRNAFIFFYQLCVHVGTAVQYIQKQRQKSIKEPSDGKQGRIKAVEGKRKKKMQDLSYIKDEEVRRAVAKGTKLISYHES